MNVGKAKPAPVRGKPSSVVAKGNAGPKGNVAPKGSAGLKGNVEPKGNAGPKGNSAAGKIVPKIEKKPKSSSTPPPKTTESEEEDDEEEEEDDEEEEEEDDEEEEEEDADDEEEEVRPKKKKASFKIDSDDNFQDFRGVMDNAMLTYGDGGPTDPEKDSKKAQKQKQKQKGQKGSFSDILNDAEKEAALAAGDLDDEEEGEGEEEEESSSDDEEGESSEEEARRNIQWIFDPDDPDLPRGADEGRKFYLGNDSFLTLVDPGLADALNPKVAEEHAEKTYKGTRLAKEEYKKMCDELGIKPVKKFLDNLKSEEMDLTDYGLTDKDIIAMCAALCNNTHVKKVSFRGAAAGAQGGAAIANMIENNYTITHLDISSTEILPAFEAICQAVQVNISLEVLKVAMNELGDKEMVWVASFLREVFDLRELDLSRNYIQDQGLFNLSKGMYEKKEQFNESLEKLDLCWNRIRGAKKAYAFFDACGRHPAIWWLDLWGNSMLDAGVGGITRVLQLNKQLEFMNISLNRFGDKACAPLGQKLNKTEALVNFVAGPNLWREKAVIKMITPLSRKNQIPLEKLDLSVGFPVSKHFLKMERKVFKVKPDLEIIHGEEYGLRHKARPDPKQLVIKRANVVCENFNTPLEMLINELRTEPETMDEAEFKKFIKSCNLYKDKAMTESFMRNFEMKAKGVGIIPRVINCQEIIDYYDKEFPINQFEKKVRLPKEPVEPKKKKEKKKGKGKKGKKGPPGRRAGKAKNKKKK